MSGPNSTDTTTTLNPGVGGDSMDESSVVQSDGTTTGKRPRADIGFQADDPQNRLVSKNQPLPVELQNAHHLAHMAQTLDEILHLLRQLATQ